MTTHSTEGERLERAELAELSDVKRDNEPTEERYRLAADQDLNPAVTILSRPLVQKPSPSADIDELCSRSAGDFSTDVSPESLLWLLNEIDLAVGIVNASAAVSYANRRLRNIASANDGIAIVRGHMSAVELLEALPLEGTGVLELGHTFCIRRPSGAKPFLCLLRPMPRQVAAPRRFTLFAVDPAKPKAPGPREIAELFGVTNQEARIASFLAGGARLDEASTRMGISIGTARFHLKNLLGKTATGRQAELLRYIGCLFDKVL